MKRALRFFVLNDTAAYIWIRSDEGASDEEIARALADRLSGGDAQVLVEETRAQWREAGLLDTAEPAPTPKLSSPSSFPPPS